ncbi:MAG: tetratricopeptide repeat protein [Deltaproteobacteria bacterium]|nr:tetratricopeptide repeat protein [Deltaproteobacteria bacterium]
MSEPPRRQPAYTAPPESAPGALTSEEFLFHMYRGSELLQEDRVHEAKEEIENALRLQPRDAKGQALLAMVYFRLGMYPRAISIYEEIIASFPSENSPRINLSLCYLKTGQPERARTLLEEVVRIEPKHERAWGYLGLAFERLHDLERARHCFERAGQKAMARRMIDQAVGSTPTEGKAAEPAEKTEVRRAAAEAFHGLDDGDASFTIANGVNSDAVPAGGWQEVSAAHPAVPPPARVPTLAPAAAPEPIVVGAPAHRLPHFARETTFAFPADARVALVDRSVLVRVHNGFGVRLDLVRAMIGPTAGIQATPLFRRTRGRVEDLWLGSSTRPLSLVTEATRLVLQATRDRRLAPVLLDGDFVYVREDSLAGFDQSLSYENGRLPIGEGEAANMVRVHGHGYVVLDMPAGFGAVEVTSSSSVVVRRDAILGWSGRLVPRALAAMEAPVELRECVAFSGDGCVWIEAPGF